MSGRVLVKVTHPHVDPATGDSAWDSYHEWYATSTRIAADRNGRPNPRMIFRDWILWQCNNTNCPAQALVHLDAVLALLPPAEATS